MIVYKSAYNNINESGGKANGLFKLRQYGFNVPDFFIVTASTFKEVLEAKNEDITKALLLHFEFSKADKANISSILKAWNFPGIQLVVRSSIVDEDGCHHSFAGIMDSYLHINSEQELFDRINAVAASAYSDRALQYRREKNIVDSVRPAIIVQIQLDATISGAMFSTWPQYPQELAIHAVHGFGDKLMNGEADAQEYYLLKKNATLNRLIKHDTADQPLLNAIQLSELYSIAIKLEQQLQMPQDIEFVYSKDQLFIVQSRPITQSIPPVVVYDNSNIQESYCGVTTPLTFSFAQKAYATVYNQTMKTLHLSPKIMEENQDVVNNLLGLVKGRIYYNINNWYKGLQLLPSFKQNKADMERMMGVLEPVDFVEDRRLSFLEKVRLIPTLIKNLLQLLAAFRNLKNTVPAFLENFQKHYALFYSDNNFYPNNNNASTSKQLLTQLDFLDINLLQQWSTPIVNDFYVMMSNGKVQRLLKKAGVQNPDGFISHYLSGNQEIASAQPSIAMQHLAVQAVRNHKIHQLILQLPSDIHSQTKDFSPEFYAAVTYYIELYGDRTIGELKLETITMREDPLILYKYLRNIVNAAAMDHAEKTGVLRANAEAQLEELLRKKNNRLKKQIYASLYKLQEGIQHREAMRLERTRLFGMYRHVFLCAGRWFYSQGIIFNERDIFYLTINEIRMYLERLPSGEDIKKLLLKRQEEFTGYAFEEIPSRIEVPSPPPAHQTVEYQSGNLLNGAGCVPGKVTGKAIVVTSTSGNLDVQGKIIVAERTDPGWSALFPSCKAVLISKGSSLSHSVILLREFGIPAIINIPHLIKRIKTGMTLAIDGDSGEIRIIDHEEN